jgi:organic hydroperoxide reductase OsmC/OhrA
MPPQFPHRFDVDLAWLGDARCSLDAPPRPPIVGGAPPEFDGKPDWWSPEHLLLASLQLCLQGTFTAIAKRAELLAAGYRSRATGILEKGAAGIAWTSITITVDLTVATADVERAREVLAKAKKHCIIANALKTETTLVANVNAK